jgi:MoaA/NifB/PqqE/SkfB family radical SAM enzyme
VDLVVVDLKSNILATIDVTSYTLLKELYEDLLALKKDVFAEDERIVIIYNSTNQKDLIDELLEAIDIPEFFVTFETNDNTDGINFKFSDSFCIYPWVNLEVNPTGQISPCCMSQLTVANLSDTTLQDAYQSDAMAQLRQNFLDNKYPGSCSTCWKDEAVGKPSMRQRAKHKFKEIYYRLNYQKEDISNLQVFDLKLGNSCNLGCKICNPESSSTIAQQEYTAGKISTVEFQKIKQSVKWAESEEFWRQMLELVQNVKYLDLYGGEPLMSKTHFKFIENLIELGVAKDIKIDYNSNGTIYSEKFFDLWKHFKEIKISFSIDDIGDRFEEQRVGANWKIVLENIQKYNARRSKTFITEIFPTINTQNVFYLPELLEWIETQQFDHVAFNILHNPYHYNVLSLDDSTKQNIISKLRSNSNNICKSIVLLLENSIK